MSHGESMAKKQDNRSDSQCLDDLASDLEDLERELEALRPDGDAPNVFEALGITSAEIRHSNMIAWLMRPDDSHGLGGRVLSALIEHAGGIAPEGMDDFRVMRESDNIDILAASAKSRLTLAMENKVWSGEHDDQLARYREAVECRYPDYVRLYLFLSPHGTPPEGEDDRNAWVPIDYRALIGFVEGAMGSCEISGKARMLIGDYVDSVRRHIVGDESLQERCVEVYLKHKRAIDLIMENLPDTTKTVHQYVRDWARGLRGVEVVDPCSRGKQYVRFRTKGLEARFPPVDGSDGWGQRHYWFYELSSRPAKDGVGCDLSLQLCFHLPKGAPLPKERVEASHAFVDAFSGGACNVFHGVWTGCYGHVAYLAPGELDYDGVAEACDEAWAGFLEREARAISAVFGDRREA